MNYADFSHHFSSRRTARGALNLMADSEKQDSNVFDLARIQDLIALMKEHELTRIDLRQGDQQIRLARGGEPVFAAPPPMAAAPQPAPVAAAPAAPVEDEQHITIIRSPMVGTFYSRANPNSEPFVKIGDQVQPETVCCIIEAMKVFNEIPAEMRGRIVAVLVDDEEPVEFGKPLFKVDTRE